MMVNGEDIAADHPAYMKHYEHNAISGSSVATALASAIASLALLLRSISTNGPNDAASLGDKDEMLRVVFSKMGLGGRGIQPSKLFGEGFSTDERNMRDPAWVSSFNGLSSKYITRDSSSDDEE